MSYFTEQRRIVLIEIISGLFISLFVYAAMNKTLDFHKFQVDLGKSPILNSFSGFVAVVIPTVEVVLSIMLILKRFQYIALYGCFSLMVMFSIYIVLILNYSSFIPCSCGGILQNMTWTQHLIFNIGFVIMAVIALLLYPARTKDLSAVRG